MTGAEDLRITLIAVACYLEALARIHTDYADDLPPDAHAKLDGAHRVFMRHMDAEYTMAATAKLRLIARSLCP